MVAHLLGLGTILSLEDRCHRYNWGESACISRLPTADGACDGEGAGTWSSGRAGTGHGAHPAHPGCTAACVAAAAGAHPCPAGAAGVI